MAGAGDESPGAAGRSNDDLAPATARGLWRTEIALRVRELCHQLRAAEAGGAGGSDGGNGGDAGGGGAAVAVAVAASTGGQLDVAVVKVVPPGHPDELRRECHAEAAGQALDDATDAIGGRALPERIHDWWTGRAITAGWEAVHQAEAELVAIGSDGDALATLPRLRVWMRQVLSDKDQLKCYEEHFDTWVIARRPDRIVLRQAYEDAISANIDWHCRLRAFRNTLFAVAGGLLALLVGLGVWHALNASVVSLCETTNGTNTCFGGGDAPPAWTIFELELVGAVAGLLSGAFLLSRLKRPPSRYNLNAPQLMLKVVAGAAAAVFGVMIVQSQAGTDSTTVLLAYAGAFGFSQQLLTRLVDRRGDDLLKSQPDGKAPADD